MKFCNRGVPHLSSVSSLIGDYEKGSAIVHAETLRRCHVKALPLATAGVSSSAALTRSLRYFWHIDHERVTVISSAMVESADSYG